jgi:hypothetical protein
VPANAVGDLAELGLAAVERRLCDEDYPNVEDDQPGEEQDESAPIERRIDPFVDHRTSTAALAVLTIRRTSASRKVDHPAN